MVMTRFIRIQLALFAVLTVIALVVLALVYLRLPTWAGVGMYQLNANLPNSGGLYATANVTYRGTKIGKVTSVEPTEQGAHVTMNIENQYRVPIDSSANVHSVSAVGEQFIDLVSKDGAKEYFRAGDTIQIGTVPAEVGPSLDAAQRGLAALPKEKIATLLDETATAVGGLGPSLQHLVDSTQAIAGDFKDNIGSINDIIENSGPIIDSQVNSGDAISRWAKNLNTLAAQSAQNDDALRAACSRRRRRPISSTRCSAMCRSRCRRRWPTWKSSSTCSSGTTRTSSRCW